MKKTKENIIKFVVGGILALSMLVIILVLILMPYIIDMLYDCSPPAEFFTLIMEMRKVGVHMNRILRKAEAGGFLDVPMIREGIKKLYATEDMLYAVFQNEEAKGNNKNPDIKEEEEL